MSASTTSTTSNNAGAQAPAAAPAAAPVAPAAAPAKAGLLALALALGALSAYGGEAATEVATENPVVATAVATTEGWVKDPASPYVVWAASMTADKAVMQRQAERLVPWALAHNPTSAERAGILTAYALFQESQALAACTQLAGPPAGTFHPEGWSQPATPLQVLAPLVAGVKLTPATVEAWCATRPQAPVIGGLFMWGVENPHDARWQTLATNVRLTLYVCE